ncbi:MAG: hypothetical protein AMJ53_18550, partial [Gammaproteobacteria bacterium SG8_11]
NTEKDLLDFVLATIGAGKITKKRTTHSHHTPSYTYAIYNRQALTLLEQIHLFLRTYKRERAALILRDYLALTPRNGKYSEVMKLARTKFETALLEIKPAIT